MDPAARLLLLLRTLIDGDTSRAVRSSQNPLLHIVPFSGCCDGVGLPSPLTPPVPRRFPEPLPHRPDGPRTVRHPSCCSR
uniref:Putative secreted protein n=1 Tax=Anopheles darlingi TaxID=43151 RepID=A0A2M4DHK8_ANODA